jgi:hypothetical protein
MLSAAKIFIVSVNYGLSFPLTLIFVNQKGRYTASYFLQLGFVHTVPLLELVSLPLFEPASFCLFYCEHSKCIRHWKGCQ